MNAGGQRRIFVVEDDAKIAAVLKDYLCDAGYVPELFASGAGLEKAVRADPPAAIILDLNLPGMDGLTICRRLRSFASVPVVMLTARVDEIDRLAGLDGGADDYVCKPFSAKEVLSRLGALIRRSEGRVTDDPATSRTHHIDTDAMRIAWRGEWMPLSPAEYMIASTMMRQPGRVFSRDQLLDRLGARSDDTTERAIDSHIKNIRRKFAEVDSNAKCFVSVYGSGYRFDAP